MLLFLNERQFTSTQRLKVLLYTSHITTFDGNATDLHAKFLVSDTEDRGVPISWSYPLDHEKMASFYRRLSYSYGEFDISLLKAGEYVVDAFLGEEQVGRATFQVLGPKEEDSLLRQIASENLERKTSFQSSAQVRALWDNTWNKWG
jgi:hypothetical protein